MPNLNLKNTSTDGRDNGCRVAVTRFDNNPALIGDLMSRLGAIAIYLILWVVLIVGPGFAAQPEPSAQTRLSAKDQSAAQAAPKAVYPKKEHDFGEVFEGTEIKYDFVIENQGDAPLVIKNIRPD
ncbi:MAG: DUF1573 domain-containing protein [Desulfobacteraceae bacterium]|jgi:hypothetical protein